MAVGVIISSAPPPPFLSVSPYLEQEAGAVGVVIVDWDPNGIYRQARVWSVCVWVCARARVLLRALVYQCVCALA